MKTFEKLLLTTNRWVLILLLASMSCIVFANVLIRYLTDASIPWSEEVARHMMIWLTFLGMGMVLRSGGHIAIDNLQDALPERAAQAMRWFVVVTLAGFLCVLLGYGLVYVDRTMFQTTAATEIPFGYIYMAMPVGCVLTLIHLAFVAPNWIKRREFIADEDFDATASASL